MARAVSRRLGLRWAAFGAAAGFLSCGGDISIGAGEPAEFGGSPSIAGSDVGVAGSTLSLGGRAPFGGTTGRVTTGGTTLGGATLGGATTSDGVAGVGIGIGGVGGVPYCDTSDPKRGIGNCGECCLGEVCLSDVGCRAFSCDTAAETCSLTICSQPGDCGLEPGSMTTLGLAARPLGLCYADNELFIAQNDGAVVRLAWPSFELIGTIPSVRAYPGDCAVLDGFLYYPNVSGAYPNVTSGSIVRVDLATSSTSVAFPSPAPRPRAIAADGNTLWISADDASQVLFNVSAESATLGHLLRTLPLTAMVNACDGLVATPTGLWCSDIAAAALLKISKQDGTLLEGPFFMPPWYGLELIDGNLWAASDGFVYDQTTGFLTGPNDAKRSVATLGLHGSPL